MEALVAMVVLWELLFSVSELVLWMVYAFVEICASIAAMRRPKPVAKPRFRGKPRT
jgi:hypothetical protein